jgi:hypothetical protein
MNRQELALAEQLARAIEDHARSMLEQSETLVIAAQILLSQTIELRQKVTTRVGN